MGNDVKFPVLGGQLKRLRDMGDGTYADVVAAVLLMHDTTRQYFFNLESLPVAARQYDATSGSLVSETRGPDRDGNSFKNTYGYDSQGRITTESGWVRQ